MEDTASSEAELQQHVMYVNAFAFTKTWIADELAVAQEADPDIGQVHVAERRNAARPGQTPSMERAQQPRLTSTIRTRCC